MLLSGGIDSATALYLTKAEYSVRALTFEYAGIAQRELEASDEIAGAAGVEGHRHFRLPDLKEAGDIDKRRFPGMPSTYIPGRNGIFYACAASFAEEVGASVILGGHNADDSTTFVDATPLFFRELEEALKTGSIALASMKLRVELPLAGMSKAEVIRTADRAGVPLASTWSCHRDGPVHCWRCEGCAARTRAFKSAGVADPLRPKERGKLLKR